MIGLMLRQQVPPDKERITFDNLYDVDDMWIWLFYQLHKKMNFSHSEIWMWGGGPRTVRYTKNFVEKWYPKYPHKNIHFDFVFSRGGFPVYVPVMQACSNAFRLYYAATAVSTIPKFNPKTVGDTTGYNLILADSQSQYDELKNDGYNVHKFMKPCAENIFKPIDVEKKHDVLFMANAKQKSRKGHHWFFDIMAGTNLKILQVGNLDNEVINYAKSRRLDIEFAGWVPRYKVSELACQAKVGVCCSTGDSCPRIIPEMLAMNMPVVIKKHPKLFIWDEYFKDESCVEVDEYDFVDAIRLFVATYGDYSPRKFYLDNLSLDVSSSRLIEDIYIHKKGTPLE